MAWNGFASPNSQSYGYIGNQSLNGQGPGWWTTPWGSPQSDDPMIGFNQRNYAPPKPATQPTPPVTPAAGPQAPSTPDLSALTSALAQTLPAPPQGLGTYQTGIQHGTLGNDVIGRANQALSFKGGKMPTASGVPVSGQAASGLNRQWNDLMAQGTSGMQGDLSRDAAYQQGQMQLAQEKAKANAAMGGFKLMQNQYEDNVQNALARRGQGFNLLGILAGLMEGGA
jgi:hypothetical protein